MLIKLLTVLSLFLIASCGKNKEDDTNVSQSKSQTVRFYDSKVSNLMARGDYQDYITDNNGYIKCIENEILTWTLAGIDLGQTICNDSQSTIYPTTLTNGDITDSWTTNLGVLLISLDQNSDPSDGINLPNLGSSDFSSINSDLFGNSDINNNGTSDEIESILLDINAQSGITYNLVTNSEAQVHFEISFGTNASITKDFNNTTEISGSGSCPTEFTVKIKDDSLGFNITTGSYPLDLNNFEQISAIRDLSNNDFDIIYESKLSSLDSGLCNSNGGFLKSNLIIDGQAYYNSGAPNTDGSYSYSEICSDGTNVTICSGSWTQ